LKVGATVYRRREAEMSKESARTAAIEAAKQRRQQRSAVASVRFQWMLDEVVDKVAMTMKSRVQFATAYLEDRIVRNISRPVTKTPTVRKYTRKVGNTVYPAGSQYTKVTDRSKKGEFPKADTTQLMKTIFMDTKETAPNSFEGYVGTPLWYGMTLETDVNLDRKYLTRTLNEEKATIIRILTGPLK
jgi:uncharacterized protein (DUF2147 family)